MKNPVLCYRSTSRPAAVPNHGDLPRNWPAASRSTTGERDGTALQGSPLYGPPTPPGIRRQSINRYVHDPRRGRVVMAGESNERDDRAVLLRALGEKPGPWNVWTRNWIG